MNQVMKTLDKTKGHLSAASKMAKHQLPHELKKAHDVQIILPKKSGMFSKLILPLTAAAVALLFAPKSGRELRADIKNRAMNLKETGMDKVHNLTDEFKETYQEVSDQMDDEGDMRDMADVVAEVSNIPDASDDPAAGVGNVHGTPFEPTSDETVPADKMDEVLADQHVSSEEELNDRR